MNPLHLPRMLVDALLRVYQGSVSPDHSALGKALYPGGYCKFNPTCSSYARTAVLRFGVIRGGWLATKRVFRCNPWNRGGDDPCPLH